MWPIYWLKPRHGGGTRLESEKLDLAMVWAMTHCSRCKSTCSFKKLSVEERAM
jgi:heterodisulfide reductase subunit A-like polyferredoxin